MRPGRASRALLLAFVTLAPTRATTAVLELGPRQIEAVPAESWLPRAGTWLRLGVAQPVALPEVRLSFARAVLPMAGPLQVDLRAADLRAGVVREQGLGAAIAARASGVILGAGLAAEQIRVQGAGQDHRLRADLRAGFVLGGIDLAVRWEGPWAASPGAPRPEVQLVAHLSGAGWALGISRRSSRYGEAAVWSGGFRVDVDRRFALASKLDARSADVGLRARRGPLALVLSIPVVSLVGAGPAAALEWRP